MNALRLFVAVTATVATAVGAAALPARAEARADSAPIVAADTLEAGLLAEINDLRHRHGLRPLRPNRRLVAAADSHTGAMAAHGFFAHESFDGSAFWKRVRRHYTDRGFGRWAVGENLLWSSWSITPAEALQLWLDSPSHRAVLLTPKWREIGISAVVASSAPNVFGGADATIVTADFGVRR